MIRRETFLGVEKTSYEEASGRGRWCGVADGKRGEWRPVVVDAVDGEGNGDCSDVVVVEGVAGC